MAADVLCFDPALERLDREVLQQHQWQRLQNLARRIWPTNAFYRAKWMAAGIRSPQDLETWDDLRKLPVTTKDELVRDQAANPPFGTNLTFPVRQYVRLHQTSGTTGKPLRWLDTAEDWGWWARLWCHVYAGAGVTPADRIFFAFSFGPFVGFWSAHAGARRLGALCITTGGQDTVVRLEAIRRIRPTVFLSTPSYALHLAEVAAARGFDLRQAGIRTTIHAGEPGAAIPATRERIQNAFGARAYDHTGATEIGAHGFECVHQCGTHLIENEFLCEVLDPVTLEPVGEGQEGELVITNLARYGMPLIRYRTRDRVKLSTARCLCGRSSARMVGGILGRTDDMITVRGINVFPSAIENIVRRHPVAEFRMEAHKVSGMDDLRLIIEPEANLDEGAVRGLVSRLTEELRAGLSLRIPVSTVPPDSLPRAQMKAKRLVRVP